MNAVFEAAQYVDASDPSYTFIIYKPGEPRDMPILKAGNVAAPGAIVPRGFPAVLAKGETTFKQGSGRLELADRLVTRDLMQRSVVDISAAVSYLNDVQPRPVDAQSSAGPYGALEQRPRVPGPADCAGMAAIPRRPSTKPAL